jgi:hypothetical protein
MSNTPFQCASCGKSRTEVGAGGIYIAKDGSAAVNYLLCTFCVIEFTHQPEQVTERIELRLGGVGGSA